MAAPRKEAEWNTEVAEAVAVVCCRWGGTVLLPCVGIGEGALTDLRALFRPFGVTVMHSIGGARGMLAQSAGGLVSTVSETLTFKAG